MSEERLDAAYVGFLIGLWVGALIVFAGQGCG